MKKKLSVLSYLFLVAIFGFGFISLPFNAINVLKTFRNSVIDEFQIKNYNFSAITKSIDKSVLANFPAKGQIIDGYGLISVAMDKQVVFDVNSNLTVYKTKAGQLVWISTGIYQIDPAIKQLIRLKAHLDELDIPLLYVNAPMKLSIETNGLPYGVKDYSVENLANLHTKLEEAHIPYFELRRMIRAEKMTVNDIFYRTDHHWKTEIGLWSSNQIMQEMAKIIDLQIDPTHLDPTNYNTTTYENWFLGSLGKRVGSTYAEPDDFTVMTPRFETNYVVEFPVKGTKVSGRFEDTLLTMNYLTPKNYYRGNPYAVNMGGDHDYLRITNLLGEGKPKILVVKDSYADVVLPFMASEFSEMAVIDLRLLSNTNLPTIIEDEKPDMVIIVYSVGMMVTTAAFNFMGD